MKAYPADAVQQRAISMLDGDRAAVTGLSKVPAGGRRTPTGEKEDAGTGRKNYQGEETDSNSPPAPRLRRAGDKEEAIVSFPLGAQYGICSAIIAYALASERWRYRA